MPKHEGEWTHLRLDRPCVQPSLHKDTLGPASCSVIEDFPSTAHTKSSSPKSQIARKGRVGESARSDRSSIAPWCRQFKCKSCHGLHIVGDEHQDVLVVVKLAQPGPDLAPRSLQMVENQLIVRSSRGCSVMLTVVSSTSCCSGHSQHIGVRGLLHRPDDPPRGALRRFRAQAARQRPQPLARRTRECGILGLLHRRLDLPCTRLCGLRA